MSNRPGSSWQRNRKGNDRVDSLAFVDVAQPSGDGGVSFRKKHFSKVVKEFASEVDDDPRLKPPPRPARRTQQRKRNAGMTPLDQARERQGQSLPSHRTESFPEPGARTMRNYGNHSAKPNNLQAPIPRRQLPGSEYQLSAVPLKAVKDCVSTAQAPAKKGCWPDHNRAREQQSKSMQQQHSNVDEVVDLCDADDDATVVDDEVSTRATLQARPDSAATRCSANTRSSSATLTSDGMNTTTDSADTRYSGTTITSGSKSSILSTDSSSDIWSESTGRKSKRKRPVIPSRIRIADDDEQESTEFARAGMDDDYEVEVVGDENATVTALAMVAHFSKDDALPPTKKAADTDSAKTTWDSMVSTVKGAAGSFAAAVGSGIGAVRESIGSFGSGSGKSASSLSLTKRNAMKTAKIKSTYATPANKRTKLEKRPVPIVAGASLAKNRYPGNVTSEPISNKRTTRSSMKEADDRKFYNADESWRCSSDDDKSAIRHRTRSVSKKAKTSNEVIEVDDSDDDDVAPNVQFASQFDAARIAVGSLVQCSDCHVVFTADDKLRLSWRKVSKDNTVYHEIGMEDILQAKHFIPDESDQDEEFGDDEEGQMSFLSLNVEPNTQNGLYAYSKSYKFDRDDGDVKKYVVVEFRSDTDCRRLLDRMLETPWASFVGTDTKLNPRNTSTYARSLIAHSERDRLKRNSAVGSPFSKRVVGFLAGRKDDDTLIVYPFDGDKRRIEQAAEGLHEVNGRLLRGEENVENAAIQAIDQARLPAVGADDDVDANTSKKIGRGHYVTVQVCDYNRLEPGEFLNDTLIDFWMSWMTRHTDRSQVHVFTSHFYTALDKGIENVTKWTKNKSINVFQKKMIFIPINSTLHWSLCVVINPGAIVEHENIRKDGNRYGDDENLDKPFPFMFFFDSLKAHRKAKVARDVRGWLNSEWTRLNAGTSGPFLQDNMRVYAPTIPYQDNSWDCGVFVCRYAFALHQLRDRTFSYRDAGVDPSRAKRPLFQELISYSPEFNFNMGDIKRIRGEFVTLIENLSTIYIPWSEEEARKEKEAKAAARQARALIDTKESLKSPDSSEGNCSAAEEAEQNPKDGSAERGKGIEELQLDTIHAKYANPHGQESDGVLDPNAPEEITHRLLGFNGALEDRTEHGGSAQGLQSSLPMNGGKVETTQAWRDRSIHLHTPLRLNEANMSSPGSLTNSTYGQHTSELLKDSDELEDSKQRFKQSPKSDPECDMSSLCSFLYSSNDDAHRQKSSSFQDQHQRHLDEEEFNRVEMSVTGSVIESATV